MSARPLRAAKCSAVYPEPSLWSAGIPFARRASRRGMSPSDAAPHRLREKSSSASDSVVPPPALCAQHPHCSPSCDMVFDWLREHRRAPESGARIPSSFLPRCAMLPSQSSSQTCAPAPTYLPCRTCLPLHLSPSRGVPVPKHLPFPCCLEPIPEPLKRQPEPRASISSLSHGPHSSHPLPACGQRRPCLW